LLQNVLGDVAKERALRRVLVCPSGELMFGGELGLLRRTHGSVYALAQLVVARKRYIDLGRVGNSYYRNNRSILGLRWLLRLGLRIQRGEGHGGCLVFEVWCVVGVDVRHGLDISTRRATISIHHPCSSSHSAQRAEYKGFLVGLQNLVQIDSFGAQKIDSTKLGTGITLLGFGAVTV
jgi:hypothetical protein